MEDPRSAIGIHGSTRIQSTNLFLHRRTVEINVPVADDSLLVATALCTGTPAKDKQAGDQSSPPATASTNPARNTSGQTIRNV